MDLRDWYKCTLFMSVGTQREDHGILRNRITENLLTRLPQQVVDDYCERVFVEKRS
jgi:hypothetical protein